MADIAFSFVGALDLFGQRSVTACARFMSRRHEFVSSLFPFLGHSHIAGRGFSANVSSGFHDVLADDLAGHIEFLRQSEDAIARIMSSRQVGPVEMNSFPGNHLFADVEHAHATSAPKGGDIHGEDVSHFLQGLPFRTQASRVVKVNRHHWAGHVFNLQTRDGWYVTEGIITHNCRCKYQWLYTLGQLPDEMLTEKGRSELARVRAEIKSMAAA